MFVVMITPECAPAAKVGGMADVIHGLSRELEIRGNSVEIILPKYDCMRYDQITDFQKVYNNLWVPYNNDSVNCSVYFGFMDRLKCFFIEPHFHKNFFNRDLYYGYNDDPERFAFFSKAAMEFLYKTNKHPEIIHCHDWQTGLVPVLLYEIYQHLGMIHSRVCYTLHNLKHQGVTGDFILHATGLNPDRLMNQERLQDNFNHSAVNIMKGGIVYSNFVSTVSRQYAFEAKYTEFGFGLQQTINQHDTKFGGILNGVDYNVWNPEITPYIPYKYSIRNIENKYRNKHALRNRLLLRDAYKPIVAAVCRLDHQKGIELIKHSIFYCLENACQFVLLGSAVDHSINDQFWAIKNHLNDNPDCHLEIGYTEELAQLIYAGADMIVVPSAFEPCGLTQIIAMKYGTIPVVRNVGGLASTVFDADYSSKPYHERNGYVFNDFNKKGLESALERAIGLWFNYPHYFRELMINAMKYDYSWNNPGKDYINIYNHIKK